MPRDARARHEREHRGDPSGYGNRMAVGGPLLGRAPALASIDRALKAAREGTARPLLITGEPGIGKSRLLAELAARGRAAGQVVLEGSAGEFDVGMPYA